MVYERERERERERVAGKINYASQRKAWIGSETRQDEGMSVRWMKVERHVYLRRAGLLHLTLTESSDQR